MKKMVCEICGSQSIRKENGVFVCQECGTEYSLEEAKGLLQDVDAQPSTQDSPVSSKNTLVSGKDKLLNSLYLWTLNLSQMPDVLFWFNISKDAINTDHFWNVDVQNICEKTIQPNFPKIPNTSLYLSRFTNGGGTSFWIKKWDSDEEWWQSWMQKNPQEYKKAKDSYDIAYRFYNRKGVIAEFIEGEAKNDLFQDKMKDFFTTYRKYLFDDCPLFAYFPSTSGTLKSVPGKGVVIEVENPKIIELSTIYNTHVIGNDKKLYKIVKGTFRDKIEYAPDSATSTFRDILKTGSDIVHEFIEKHNEMMNYCAEHYSEVCDLMKEVRDNCIKLESDLFIPYKYRSIPIILSLIDLVNDGKATTWQDLINLYDTHQYRIGVYERLDTINAKLDVINQTMVSGFATVVQGMGELYKKISAVNDKMAAINTNIASIKKYSFITMWNTL